MFAALLGACEAESARDTHVELDTDIESPEVEVTEADTKLEDPDSHPCPELEIPAGTRLWGSDTRAPLALRLPTPPGLEAVVSQGNDGDYTHVADQRFAWDFAVPYGTAVHAAATGIVVWVEDTQVGAGPGSEWRDHANFVVLDHGGGLFTSYVHLAAGSARVFPGDVALVGEVLAETGESGQMTGPHLHFQVENVWSESVPAAFARASGCDWIPVVGERVVSRPYPLADDTTTSVLPPETFAEDGVVDVTGLPARLLLRDATYTIAGRAPARSATEVYFLALPPEGGTALFARRFEVTTNRYFEGELVLDELPAGQYGWALVAGTGQAVRVPRSVRAAVIE